MAISVNLTDPARVAGFVNPGSEVTIFMSGTDPASTEPFTRMLLDRVTVLGVGSTTPTTTTTTTEEGAGGRRAAAQDAAHPVAAAGGRREGALRLDERCSSRSRC